MTGSIADLADAMLVAMLTEDQSIADLGGRKSKVLKRLEKDKLVTIKRGVATLTESGKTVANKIKAASDHLRSEFDEHEIEFGRAAVAMLAAGYTVDRCRWPVTCAMLAFRQMEAVQNRRAALHVVDDGRVAP